MKRAIVMAVLLLIASALLAQTVNEIPCRVLASGGGRTESANHSLIAVLGQPIVGVSAALDHQIRHGYSPCSPSQTPIGVEETSSPTPAEYALHQNSPNPFNPRTVIWYEVPVAAGRVAIKIYDFGGRYVCTLVDRVESPGRHQITWAGTDDDGLPVASGLYIAVLETPVGRFNKKMALIR